MKIQLFDSHCHPQFPQYDGDRDEIIVRALDAGIGMLCVGTDIETSKRGVELARKYDGIWVSVGVHPNDINGLSVANLNGLVSLLKEPKVIAIGEIGLDYYRTIESEKQEIQKSAFKKFLDLALEHDKPVIIHARDAAKGSAGRVHADVLSILEFFTLKGVAHSFTGTLEEAQRYIKLGFYLGFNGIITFSNMYDEVVRSVPLERILLETDAPYLAPEPFRGKRNEPAYMDKILRQIACLKGESVDIVAQATTVNSKRLFDI